MTTQQLHSNFYAHRRLIAACMACCLMLAGPLNAATIYVNANSSACPAGDGQAWATAFCDLQDAIDAAAEGDQIWVAQGVYLPSKASDGSLPGNDRLRTFFINKDIALYGGFAGHETALQQRNWAANPTVLSGDVGTAGLLTDNAYHVLWMNDVSSAARVDGFTIEKGYANGPGGANSDVGGGLYVNGDNGVTSSPFIANCTFQENYGSFSSGSTVYVCARWSGTAQPEFWQCVFVQSAGGPVSGMFRHYARASGRCEPEYRQCTFYRNNAPSTGYEVTTHVEFGAPSDTRAVVTGYNTIIWNNNRAALGASGGFTSAVSHINLNYCLTDSIGSRVTVVSSIAHQDPLLENPVAGIFKLQAGSPAINAGNNDYLDTLSVDLGTGPRLLDGTVDIGAFEFSDDCQDPVLASIIARNADCHDSADGMLMANASGGIPPYQYLWSNGQSTPNLDSLPAGTYQLTISDAASCQGVFSAQITAPAVLEISCELRQAVTLPGQSQGEAELDLAGGTPPYTLSYSDSLLEGLGEGITVLDGLAEGSYELLLTDANGCSASCSFMIEVETSPLTLITHPAEGFSGDTLALPVTVLGFEDIAGLSATLELHDGPPARLLGIRGGALPSSEIAFNLLDSTTMTMAWSSLPEGRSLMDGDTVFWVEVQLFSHSDKDCARLSMSGAWTELLAVQLLDEQLLEIVPEVIDSSLVCLLQLLDLAGQIRRKDSMPLQNVSVWLEQDSLVSITDANGSYGFSDLLAGLDYRLRPEKDTLPRNGVNVIDVVRLQQHILNNPLLDCPYTIIAADVSGDGFVNVLDVSILIQLILFGIDEFPGLPSWRFVPAEYVFPDPAAPFSPVFPEAIELPGLAEARLSEDFIAIKLGDLDLSASTGFGSGELELRSSHQLVLHYPDWALEAGQAVDLPIYADDFTYINGLQMALHFDPQHLMLEGVLPGALPGISFNDGEAGQGWLGIVWADWENGRQGLKLDGAAPLFYLRLRAPHSLPSLAGQLGLNGRMQAFALEASGQPLRISLGAEQLSNSQPSLGAPMRLEAFPNPFGDHLEVRAFFPAAASGQLELLDARGRTLRRVPVQAPSGQWSQSLPSLTELPAGFYLLRLRTEQGAVQLKLIKNH